MERLVRLAMVLHHAGPDGVPAGTLVRVAGFEGGADPGSQLARELRHMRNVGWQIDNIAAPGEDARYRMTSIDTRLRVQLSDPQQAALRRAVILADRADLADRLGLPSESTPTDLATALAAPPDEEALETVLRAVRLHCLLHFRYKGSMRVVHPGSVRATNRTWHLGAWEDGPQDRDDRVKDFVVSRMSEVSAEAPDTARVVSTISHPGLNPMSWEIDAPIEVTIRSASDYAPDVRRWLGTPVSETTYDEETEFGFLVTNRAGLRSRLYQLGDRVRVIGPPEVLAEIIDELSAMAGE
jgi:predicted DNA-binding transcriptional regulator YafY